MNSHASGDHNRWICPNDRVLTFRAKLDAGWSVRSTAGSSLQRSVSPSPSVSPYASTSNLSMASSASCLDVGVTNSAASASCPITSNISDEEQEKILRVISRAKRVEQAEKDRIQRLTDRLHNMKRNSTGNGRDHCALCGEKLRFFSFRTSSFDCQECGKLVCNKCVVDHINPETSATSFYCKVCSESREIWKKSGAWFLKALPTFPLVSSSAAAPATASSGLSPSSSSTASFCANQSRYFLRSESPPSPTGSLNSLDSSLTASSFSVNVPVSPVAAAPVAHARPPVHRTVPPPTSLPASPASRHKLNLYLSRRAGNR